MATRSWGNFGYAPFSPTGQIAINKGYAARLNGKPIGLNGFNFAQLFTYI
jgi:hypothetical protein